jgi:cell division protein ZapA
MKKPVAPPERQTTAVTIFGQQYRLSSTAPVEHMHAVADHVDEVMRELHARLEIASSTRLAILAALHIADQLFRERSSRTTDLSRVEESATNLGLLLDESLGSTRRT